MPVALRKESVDRNLITKTAVIIRIHVALRKESVDRNIITIIEELSKTSRSPQGERG